MKDKCFECGGDLHPEFKHEMDFGEHMNPGECIANLKAKVKKYESILSPYNPAALPRLVEAVDSLLGTIEAHNLESLSCDGDGEKWCGCLESEVDKTYKALAALGKGE